MAAPIDWSAIELCVDGDLFEVETNSVRWVSREGDASIWRAKAKELIGNRLKITLNSIATAEATTVDDVRDLIANPEELKIAAVYLTFHLIASDKMKAPGDFYDTKARQYYQMYEDELGRALQLINIDTDESGTIEDSEKYNTPTGATIRLGG